MTAGGGARATARCGARSTTCAVMAACRSSCARCSAAGRWCCRAHWSRSAISWRAPGAHGVTHISGTPVALAAGADEPGDAAAWRRVMCACRARSPTRRSSTRLRAAYPEADIAHAFASTEAGVAFDVGDGFAGFPETLLGQPRRCRDAGRGRLAADPLGAHRAALSRRRTAPLLFDEDGFVDTGDMIELRDGRYYFVGRRGGVINVGGLKVHPEEVEAVINRHPGVRMSLVKARKNPITGAIVVADIVLNGAPTPVTRMPRSKAKSSSSAARGLARAQGAGGDPLRAGAGGCRVRQAGARASMSDRVTSSSPAAAAVSASRIAGRLRDAGYRVIAVARKQSDELVAALREADDVLHFWPFDLADLEAHPRSGQGDPQANSARSTVSSTTPAIGTSGVLANMRDRRYRAHRAAQHRLADGADQVCRAGDDGRRRRRTHRQYLLDRRLDRVQRAVGLRRDQGVADRLHQIAGARSRAARHHRQCGRARLCRHGDDRGHGRRPARAGRAAQPARTASPRSTMSPMRSNSCSATRRATSPAPC